MKIGFLGAGNIAVTMATTLQSVKGAECYAVASRDKKRAQEFADKFGFEKAYGSYTDMLSDPYVKLVYISTPHSHHYDHIKMCLDHDKHVICEKAFTANAAQAEEVLAIAEEKNLFITEAIWTRYMPMRNTINRVIRSGIIGKPTSLSANLGYPLEHVKRLTSPELAGGALLDLGVYVLNFASMVFGDEITGIVADCIKYDSGVDAQETIMLTYSDGKMASLYVTMLAQTDRRGIINGSNGYIEIENINNYESIRVYNLERKVVAEYAAPVQITGYEYEINSAMDAIKEGALECREMPHYEIVRMMQLMDSLREAWGIKFPFESEDTSPKKRRKDDGKTLGARMITEQHIKEGTSNKVNVAPDAVTETLTDSLQADPSEDEIKNMIHVIHTPPIDKRGETKRHPKSGKTENNVKILNRPAPTIKSRASGLRAGSVEEMREKLENERKEKEDGSAVVDASGGFLGDIVLENEGNEGASHSAELLSEIREAAPPLNKGGEARTEMPDAPAGRRGGASDAPAGRQGGAADAPAQEKGAQAKGKGKVIRIVDDAVRDYVDIDPGGTVTISAQPKTEIRVNEALVRRLSPSSAPLEDEGVVSEVLDADGNVKEPANALAASAQIPVQPAKEEPKKKSALGRLLGSMFGGDSDDDYLDE